MNKIIIAGIASVALGIAGLAPATANADASTDAFLDVLHAQNIGHEYGDGMLITAGEMVCERLSQGYSPMRVARSVYAESELIEPESAGYFVGASISAFCPAFAPDIYAGSPPSVV